MNLTEIPMQDSEGANPTNSNLLNAGTSSRGRQQKMLKAMAESLLQRNFYGDFKMFYMASQSFSEGQTEADLYHDNHLDLQKCMRNPVAFHAELMGDIMYFHQAIRQPDAQEFVKAVVKEVEAHVKDNHWELVKQSEVPPGMDVLPSIWAMHCK